MRKASVGVSPFTATLLGKIASGVKISSIEKLAFSYKDLPAQARNGIFIVSAYTTKVKDNIEKVTLENEDFRRVIFTGTKTQLVLMSIPVGGEIGLETHPHVDQFFRIEQYLSCKVLWGAMQSHVQIEVGATACSTWAYWRRSKSAMFAKSLRTIWPLICG